MFWFIYGDVVVHYNGNPSKEAKLAMYGEIINEKHYLTTIVRTAILNVKTIFIIYSNKHHKIAV